MLFGSRIQRRDEDGRWIVSVRMKKVAKPTRSKSAKTAQVAPSLPDLPRASERLKLDSGSSKKFEIPLKKQYHKGRGAKGDDSTPLNVPVGDFDTDDFLKYFFRSADEGARSRAAEALRRSEPGLFVAFQRSMGKVPPSADENLPLLAPALWEERTTGREVSPADFIRQHYAQWLGNGLTRAHIGKLDEKLYVAYARQISRTPEKALAELPSEPRQKRDDPEEALERIRAQTRASVARSRKGM